jgi:hypothetical protein
MQDKPKKGMSIIVQQDATIYSLLYFRRLLYMWLFHPSSGAHITVITASGTGQTVSATFRYREEVGTAVPTFAATKFNKISLG